MNGAGRRREDFADSSLVRSHAQSRAPLRIPSRAGSLHVQTPIFPCDSAAIVLRSNRSGRVPCPYVDAPLVGKHDFERRAACG